MAGKPPYFPFYPLDFSGDPKVEAMSTAGVGAYTLLLCRAWHEEPPASLPDTDRVLARYARMTSDEWSEVRSDVLACFDLGDDGRWYQGRLQREFEKFAAKSKKARESAQKRWAGKKRRKPPDSESNANALQRASGSGSDSLPSSPVEGVQGETPKKPPWRALIRGRPPTLSVALDTPAFTEAWTGWLTHRKESRKTVTASTADKQIRKLEQMGHDRAVAALNHSTANGWIGIFEPDQGSGSSSRNSTATARREGRAKQQAKREHSEVGEAARL